MNWKSCWLWFVNYFRVFMVLLSLYCGCFGECIWKLVFVWFLVRWEMYLGFISFDHFWSFLSLVNVGDQWLVLLRDVSFRWWILVKRWKFLNQVEKSFVRVLLKMYYLPVIVLAGIFLLLERYWPNFGQRKIFRVEKTILIDQNSRKNSKGSKVWYDGWFM